MTDNQTSNYITQLTCKKVNIQTIYNFLNIY